MTDFQPVRDAHGNLLHGGAPTLRIIPPLTPATLDDDIHVLVVQARIAPLGVDYYCEWWVDGTLHTGWFDEPRLKVEGEYRTSIGYR